MTTKELYDFAKTLDHDEIAWRYTLMVCSDETARLEFKKRFMEEAEKAQKSEEAN